MYRICNRCKEEKPFTEEYFPKHKRKKHGLDTTCLICKKARDKANYERKKEKILERKRLSYLKKKKLTK